ncbi:MAG: hypothetical protein ACI9FJ_002768 [Alteromonadaceae bacterium]|jgi:hypothetical protein
MSDTNPMIKANAGDTFDSMIETLDFVVKSLTQVQAQSANDEDGSEKYYTASEVAGLCNVMTALKEAAQAGSAQAYVLAEEGK